MLTVLLSMNGDSRGSRDLQGSTQFVCAYYSGTDVFTTEELCGFFLGFMYLQTNSSKCMSHFELLITLQATHLQNGFEKKKKKSHQFQKQNSSWSCKLLWSFSSVLANFLFLSFLGSRDSLKGPWIPVSLLEVFGSFLMSFRTYRAGIWPLK